MVLYSPTSNYTIRAAQKTLHITAKKQTLGLLITSELDTYWGTWLSLENTISISHLENRILCCELLGENKDFHKFFTTYVQRICELGFKAKLFEVCDELLGPIDTDTAKPPNENNWEPKICGFDKRELLKEIITSCSQFRDAQRVLVHFGKKIGVVIDES